MATETTTTKERIGRVGQRCQVGIPREILETLKLQEGDFVAFSEQANGVLIRPKRVADPEDVLTPAEAKEVRRGSSRSSKASRSHGATSSGPV